MNNYVCLDSVSQVWVCGYFCHSNPSSMGDPGPGSGAMDTLLHLVDSEQDRTSAKTSFFPSDFLQISKSKQKDICMFSCCHSKLMNILRSQILGSFESSFSKLLVSMATQTKFQTFVHLPVYTINHMKGIWYLCICVFGHLNC